MMWSCVLGVLIFGTVFFAVVDAIEKRDVDKAIEQVVLRHKYLSLEKVRKP